MFELGQLMMTGISGPILTKEESDFIEAENIGGVILFSCNYESPAQLAELVNSIQVLRRDYPLFIAVDHEGGRVIRFKEDFTHFPPMLHISHLNSPKLCYEIHAIMASELFACGINVNFSPCCDIFNNPKNKVIGDRAFGNTQEEVSKYISSAIRGLQTEGVLACAKHFPGHGCTVKDSHFDLPLVKKSLKDIQKEELRPFVKAVKSRVAFVMMAHIMLEDINARFPSSLAPEYYQILRKDLKFNDIIITDDMQMGAIINNFSLEESAVKAINAGADMILYRDLKYAKMALNALKEAIKAKKIVKISLNEKIERVGKCKKEHLADFRPIYIPEVKGKINKRATQSLLFEIKQKISFFEK